MTKKKASRKSSFVRAKKPLLTAVVVIVLVIAGLLAWRQFNSDSSDVKVTAPSGTTSRMDQLNASEISGETSVDTQYDSQQSTNLQSDSSLLGEVSGTADEN